jgi:hypothetical protein
MYQIASVNSEGSDGSDSGSGNGDRNHSASPTNPNGNGMSVGSSVDPNQIGGGGKRRRRNRKNSQNSTAASAASAVADTAEEDQFGPHKHSKFIQKVFEMASYPENAHTLGFSDDGLSLEIRDSSQLAPVLGRYFKHSNPSSFIRQLNNYGFKTISSSVGNNRHVFAHPHFRRDDSSLLETITRKTAVCVKKKSKGDIISELQMKNEEQQMQLQQMEMHHLEMFQRIMALEAENKQLRSHLDTMRRSFQETTSRMESIVQGVDPNSSVSTVAPALIGSTPSVPSVVPSHPHHPHHQYAAPQARYQHPSNPTTAAGSHPSQMSHHHPRHHMTGHGNGGIRTPQSSIFESVAQAAAQHVPPPPPPPPPAHPSGQAQHHSHSHPHAPQHHPGAQGYNGFMQIDFATGHHRIAFPPVIEPPLQQQSQNQQDREAGLINLNDPFHLD